MNIIRRIRRDLGLTQTAMARQLGITQSALSQQESHKIPSMQSFITLYQVGFINKTNFKKYMEQLIEDMFEE